MAENTNAPAPRVPGVDEDTGHDYDGIREYDNRLPNWWLATLLLSVVFGYGYWTYYHVFTETPDQYALYEAEVARAAEVSAARAREKGALTDDALLAMTQVAATVEAGKATYAQMCASCHGIDGQGLVGPNLTDAYWLHGAEPTSIHKAVAEGITSKGMPAWGSVLGAAKVEQVVAYLLTIKGTNVAGKEPQGELASN